MQLRFVLHQWLLALVLMGGDRQGSSQSVLGISLQREFSKKVLKQFDSRLEEKKGSVGFSNSGARTFLPDVVVGFLWSVLQCYSVQGMGDSSGYFQKSSS